MMRAVLLPALLALLGSRAGAIDFSFEYLQVPAIFQYVETDIASGGGEVPGLFSQVSMTFRF